MATNLLDKYRTDRRELESQIEALMNADDFDPAAKDFVEARGSAEALDSKIKSIVEWQARQAAANEIDSLAITTQADKAKKSDDNPVLSIGEAWTRSKAYDDFKMLPRGTSGRVSMPFDAVEKRAPILTSTFAGLIQPDRIAPSTAPAAQTPLLDLISTIRVTSGAVEWVHYPAAAPLGTVTAEGAGKTEAAIAPILKTVTLDTIASWAQYSRQFGEDAPGLVAFLNAALARGILDKREALAAATLIADANIPVVTNTGGTLMEGIRVAIAQVQTAGYSPQAVVINPADYAALDIDVFTSTMRGPSVNPSFWGVTPVPVGAVASGTAFVGDFTSGMVELVRSEVQVFTTDSHASTFISNVLTTLVEARAKTIVQRPEALAKVTGTVTALAASAGSAKK